MSGPSQEYRCTQSSASSSDSMAVRKSACRVTLPCVLGQVNSVTQMGLPYLQVVGGGDTGSELLLLDILSVPGTAGCTYRHCVHGPQTALAS